jgi:hypothetical protein
MSRNRCSEAVIDCGVGFTGSHAPAAALGRLGLASREAIIKGRFVPRRGLWRPEGEASATPAAKARRGAPRRE